MWDIAPSNGQKAHCSNNIFFSVFSDNPDHISLILAVLSGKQSHENMERSSVTSSRQEPVCKSNCFLFPKRKHTQSVIQHLCRTEFAPTSLPLHLIWADPFEMLHTGLLPPDGSSHVLIQRIWKSEGGPEPLISRVYDKNKSPLFPKSAKWSMFTMSSLQDKFCGGADSGKWAS